MTTHNMRVLMLPSVYAFDGEESGIKRVVEAYHRYGPAFGIDYVTVKPDEVDEYELISVHAGTFPGRIPTRPMVAHCHGLYWSADYTPARWEYRANADVIGSVRYSQQVTVPSAWVAEAFQRDMRISPTVIPHGIQWELWQGKHENKGYILWNKNRDADVCDPQALAHLSRRFEEQLFLTTYAPDHAPTNVRAIGLLPHAEMKQVVQQAAVYLSTTKETFGIGVLEAMASGVPVLGWAHGGNLQLVEHGVSGYLARPGSYQDLFDGLDYCLRHRAVLGANARELAKKWTWEAAMEKVAQVYKMALEFSYPPMNIDPALFLQ